jgi:hypothetical protein
MTDPQFPHTPQCIRVHSQLFTNLAHTSHKPHAPPKWGGAFLSTVSKLKLARIWPRRQFLHTRVYFGSCEL